MCSILETRAGRRRSHAEFWLNLQNFYDLEAAIQKSFHEMRDAVRSNRVHADDNQRERPFLETLYIDHPTESGQEQEADASAEDGPRRRPDAFHHWANVRIMQRQSQRNP